MLAFTDESLALITIGATALPAKERGSWLQAVAIRLDQAVAPDQTTPGARYTRRWRARRRAGQILLRAAADEAAFAVAAVEHRLLDPAVADDPAALNAAAEQVIAMFSIGELSPPAPRIGDRLRAELLAAAARRTPTNARLSTRHATSAAEPAPRRK